ncbi:hypothetical protein CF327_g7295 [Tilletia walkeri]|nr:hypothetical protein CF327_g7295 [Tilletia walkeri]
MTPRSELQITSQLAALNLLVADTNAAQVLAGEAAAQIREPLYEVSAPSSSSSMQSLAETKHFTSHMPSPVDQRDAGAQRTV